MNAADMYSQFYELISASRSNQSAYPWTGGRLWDRKLPKIVLHARPKWAIFPKIESFKIRKTTKLRQNFHQTQQKAFQQQIYLIFLK